ncbi:hypothetical protein FJY71_02925 [candidate division WOR-3 bacterium]|nr:hypothetical protein [candidate division WOR-3 bacterium]
MVARRLAACAALACLFLACPGPDHTPPSATLLYPGEGDTLRGTAEVRCRATDNDRVAAVELVVDGALLATDSTPSGSTFTFELNTSALNSDSSHLAVCVAFDPAGNQDSSLPVRFFVHPGTIHRGTIGSDQTWQAAANPHVVEGELFIAARLVLEPGVEVQMSRGSRITVLGRAGSALAGAGTEQKPIRFTSRSLAPAPGDWLGIEVEAGADSARFERCRVEYGGANRTGMVYSAGARLAISACSLGFSSSYGAAVRDSAFARFEANRVYSCLNLPVLVAPAAVASVGPGNSFAGNARNGIGVAGGLLSRPTQWPNPGMPYYVAATVSVGGNQNPTFTLAPGCLVCFAESAALRVALDKPGGLLVDGSAGTIVLAGFDSLSNWQGIEFWELTDSRSQLRNCAIERGGANGLAALICYQPVAIYGTTIRASASSGVFCPGPGFAQFQSSTVTGCDAYPLTMTAGAVGSLGAGNVLTGNGRDSIAVSAGAITADAQWRNHGLPYRVAGTVSVGSPGAPTLVIDPGAALAFAPGAGLAVGKDHPGFLLVNGQSDSVTFTGTVPAPGSWSGIELYAGSSGETGLEYCRLLYGGGSGRGILYVERCLPLVEHCEIGFSSNYCAYLFETLLDPDLLRERNWLHDWDPEYDDVFEEGLKPDQ